MENQEKVLVCITIQNNSKKLIEKGAKLAKDNNAQLHILHIERGMSIFQNPESAALLEELFKFGKDLGGEVHFISDERVVHRITTFIRDMEVSTVVLGETMRSKITKLLKRDISKHIAKEAKDLEVLVIDREDAKIPEETKEITQESYVKET